MYARISAFLVAFALALTGLAAAQERRFLERRLAELSH